MIPDDDPDTFPRYSADLVDLLDDTFPPPALPADLKAWQRFTPEQSYGLAYQAGVRSIIDTLIQMRSEKEEALGGPSVDPDPLDAATPNEDGHIVREIGVGGADPISFRIAGELPNADPPKLNGAPF